jgi:hypothetical protein
VIGGISENPNDSNEQVAEKEDDSIVDMIKTQKKKPGVTYDDIANNNSEEYVDYISSVGIPLANGETATIPVNLQTGSVANLIIQADQKAVIERLKKGTRIEKVKLNSPISVDTGSCTVISVARIDMGPKKGDYSVDLKIES